MNRPLPAPDAEKRRTAYPGPLILICAWTVIGFLSYTRHYLQQSEAHAASVFWPEMVAWLSCFYPWAALTPAVFWLERRFSRAKDQWRRNIPILGAASLLFSVVSYAMTVGLSYLVHRLQGRAFLAPDPIWAMPAAEVLIEESLFWSVFVAGYVIRSRAELHERQRENARFAVEKAQLETTLKQAELEALRMRLNPHFLFNSLQNISVLARQDPRTASRMLTRLGDLLRAALRSDLQPEVSLENEVALARAYLEVEKMRFGDRLTAEVEIAPGTERARVPSLLLQPLVENAIVHGLEGISRKGRIRIESAIEDGRLVLRVLDNGVGLPADGLANLEMGVGLGSTCDRLARMYPGRHDICVQRLKEGGTEVRIALPLEVQGEAAAAATAGNEQPSFADSRR